jgi:hypothetical protein
MTGRRILVWTAAAVVSLFAAGALIVAELWGLALLTPVLIVVADFLYQWVLRVRLRREIRSGDVNYRQTEIGGE